MCNEKGHATIEVKYADILLDPTSGNPATKDCTVSFNGIPKYSLFTLSFNKKTSQNSCSFFCEKPDCPHTRLDGICNRFKVLKQTDRNASLEVEFPSEVFDANRNLSYEGNYKCCLINWLF